MQLARNILASLTAALLVLCGCHGSSTKEISPIVSNTPLKLTFTADVKATATELNVEYTVKNDGDGDVLLLNRIATTDVDDCAAYLPGNVYVDLDGDTLRLAKMALALPDGVNLKKRSVPEVTLVSSKQSFTERFSVPLPARIRNPMLKALIDDKLYMAIKGNPAELAKMGKEVLDREKKQFSRVKLVIAYAPVKPEYHLEPVSNADLDVLRVWPHPDQEQLLFEKSFDLPGPRAALDYKRYPWQ